MASKKLDVAKVVRDKPAARAKMAARAEKLLQDIAHRKNRIQKDFYEIGIALRTIRDDKLYAALGYATFHALLEARNILGRSQAAKLITIVENLPMAKAVELGAEKAYGIVKLTQATPQRDTAVAVAEHGVRLGNKVRRVKKLSARAVTDITRKVRAQGVKASPEEKDARRILREAHAVFKKHGLRVRGDVKESAGEFHAELTLSLQALDVIARAVVRAVK